MRECNNCGREDTWFDEYGECSECSLEPLEDD